MNSKQEKNSCRPILQRILGLLPWPGVWNGVGKMWIGRDQKPTVHAAGNQNLDSDKVGETGLGRDQLRERPAGLLDGPVGCEGTQL
jgi:hypothetical protein